MTQSGRFVRLFLIHMSVNQQGQEVKKAKFISPRMDYSHSSPAAFPPIRSFFVSRDRKVYWDLVLWRAHTRSIPHRVKWRRLWRTHFPNVSPVMFSSS